MSKSHQSTQKAAMTTEPRRTVVRLPRDRRASDIEAAAREVFCERGYEATSTAEIAARAGVAEGTLYKHFQNKRALLVKVLETWYHSLIADFTTQLSGIHGTRNKLFYIVSRHLRALKEDPELASLLYREMLHSGDYYDSRIHEFNREYTQVLIETCRDGMRLGELKAELPLGLLRDMMFGGIDHLISGFLFNQREIDVESSAKQLVALIFDGISVAQAGRGNAEDDVVRRLEGIAKRMEAAMPEK